jgi:hypothetical protein
MNNSKVKAFLGAVADHHLTLCKAHADACDREGADTEFHKTCMDSHATFAEKCVDMAKALDDSLGKGFGIFRGSDEPMPTEISAVAPTVPANIRAIPRYGQRSIGETAEPIDEAFKKIVEVD